MNVFGIAWWVFFVYSIKVSKYIINIYYNIYLKFRFVFSTTHRVKGHTSQICLSGIIDDTFLPSKKSEGRCTENLRNVMVKVIR